MIEDNVGLLLHLWLTISLATLGTALLVGLLQSRLVLLLDAFNLGARQRLLWCLVLFPYAVGAYATLLVLIPSLSHKFGVALNHFHLHPEGGFEWFSWQGLISTLFAVGLMAGVLPLAARAFRSHRQLRTLLLFADTDPRGYHRVESDLPNAYTVGLIKPQILISDALTAALTREENDVVYRHERAHQQACDPLRLWLFELLLNAFWPPIRAILYGKMELLIEQQADSAVAKQCNNPILIANTLVKVNRLLLHHSRGVQPQACSFGTTAIEQRINLLLLRDEGRSFPTLGVLMGVGLAIGAGLYFAEGLHHVLEVFLHYEF